MSMTKIPLEYAIGVDIGGTNTKCGIVNRRGEVLQYEQLSTPEYENPEAFVDALCVRLNLMIEKVGGIELIKGIGIGAPNGNYYTGTIEYAPNLRWVGVVPLADMVSQRMGLATALTNDANAAAVGEMQYGAAKGMRDFITITLGTGVGSGIVANGQLIYGHDGFAGELGHTIIRPGGRPHWSTQLKGSLEAYASATGVVLTAKEMLQQEPEKPSMLRKYNLEELTSKQIFDCAMQGDEISQSVYRFTGQILGESLANFVMFSSPEAIILFGGLIKAGNLIFDPTIEHMERNLLPIFKNKVKVIKSDLHEADAAILGASALVWEMKQSSSSL
ncbi:ROK family protein [Flavihumibacter cheonanensis]|jgi:glucokinase|uniref:ROK family protein n=1 Tax=Flavihumibacter cheonanensis TaxID=1442385 RepID=UPI001EF76692|nr:ROK family protein [Flavihumibacter cheonanensis]MCG7751517.1 ROK family protein [Flavihumibacter cheonanensis]